MLGSMDLDCMVIIDDSVMHEGWESSKQALDVDAIVCEFGCPVREDEEHCLNGDVPGSTPLAMLVDGSCRFV